MFPISNDISPELIIKAQKGDKISLDCLAEAVRIHLFGYIYRLTLDYDLTKDLLQETILFMIQSISQLEQPEQFWHWMFRTALGKIQHYNREQKRRKEIERPESEQMRIHHDISADHNDGLTELLRKELSDAVFKAMKHLKLKYRNVLVLRCFENLDYAEIGQVLNISELQSRVLFFRAKTSLRKQLATDGLGNRYFLLALALFGLATNSTKTISATAITASSLRVGFPAAMLATLSSKIGLMMTIEVAAMAFALPVPIFFYALGIACVGGLGIYLICSLGNRLFGDQS